MRPSSPSKRELEHSRHPSEGERTERGLAMCLPPFSGSGTLAVVRMLPAATAGCLEWTARIDTKTDEIKSPGIRHNATGQLGHSHSVLDYVTIRQQPVADGRPPTGHAD